MVDDRIPGVESPDVTITCAARLSSALSRLLADSALTPPKLAKRWKVSPDKVLAFVDSGELKAFNVASTKSRRPRYRILLSDVLAFEQRRAPRRAPPKSSGRRRRDTDDIIEFF